MMSFITFLLEVFDSHIPYRREGRGRGPGAASYHFEHGGEHFRVAVHPTEREDEHHVVFHGSRGGIDASGLHPRTAHRIFGTVGHILRRHVADNPQVRKVSFSGGGDTRRRVYKAMARRIDKEGSPEIRDFHFPGTDVTHVRATVR